MAAPTRTRWVCPRCGDGTLGSRRPRRDDVVRYCLTCSAETGRLVQRTAPTLERQRAAKQERRKRAGRSQAERAAEAERAYYTVRAVDAAGSEHVVDLREELARACSTPLLRAGLRRWQRGHRPSLEVYTSQSPWRERRGRGTAWPWENRIRIRVWDGMPYEWLIELVHHEVVHVAVEPDEHHGAEFKRVLVESAQQRWPFVVAGRLTQGAYTLDGRIVECLKDNSRSRGADD